MKATTIVKSLGVLAFCTILIGGLAVSGRGQEGRALRQFMRQKLDHSQKVLEGLTREDYALIAKNARAMKQLSEDAQWRVSQNVNYLRMSNEFQDLADEVAGKAKDRNLDGATLAYLKLTMKCIECHKLLRDERLIGFAEKGQERGF
jgi:hypothetical protein